MKITRFEPPHLLDFKNPYRFFEQVSDFFGVRNETQIWEQSASLPRIFLFPSLHFFLYFSVYFTFINEIFRKNK